MKKITLFSSIILLILSCSPKQNEKYAVIRGEVLSENSNEIKFEYVFDNPITGKGETYIAEIDSNSNFSIEIPVERIAMGRVSIGNNYHDICLIPGDDFYISIDGDAIEYSGKGAGKNNFLYHAEINGLWNRDYYRESNRRKLTPAEFLESMKDFKQRRIDFLDSYIDSVKVQDEFVELYRTDTEVIYEALLQQYPRGYAYVNKIALDSIEIPSEYEKYNSYSSYINDSKIISFNYIHYLRNGIYRKAKQIMQSDTSLNMREAIYVAIFDSLSGKTKEYLLTKWIVSDLSFNEYDSVAIAKFNEIEKDVLAQSTFTEALNKYNEKQSLIGQPLHQEFSNTVLRDTGGIELTFGELINRHKGKVVYVDFWSMGCGPRIAAMPYAKKLKEKLKAKPIEFVYLSTEPIRNKPWEKVFEVTLTDKNHYLLENGFNSRLHKFMEMNWVPCYMIFDKEGKLIDFNADRPTSLVEDQETELEKTLKELASL